METITKTRSPDLKLKAFPFPNGETKKLEADEVIYRECLKNHAASLGGHALDGCGEFMPSLTAIPSEPTSLKCAACGCHRNFHRRIAFRHRAPLPATSAEDCLEGEGERDDGEDDSPHMLLALSTGGGKSLAMPTPVVAVRPLRKRFRSKFSPEQKDKMLELSERLGWRLQRRDEELVERWCNEIGVRKGVFKVWMHNNKYHLFGSRRGETVSGVSPPSAAAVAAALVGGGAGVCKVDENGNGMNGAC